MAEALETLDNLLFVFREHTGKPVGIYDHLVKHGMFSAGLETILEYFSRIHVVTSYHLDFDTKGKRIIDSLLGVFMRRVKDGK